MTTLVNKPVLHGRDHLADHPDPIPGLPGPSGYDLTGLILATDPDAFWKLDETSGIVANDSSGNSHHLATGGSYTAPDWGQPAGPPGTTSAGFISTSRVNGGLSAFTNNFTAGIWFKGNGVATMELLGQGQAFHSAAGWTLGVSHHGSSPGGHYSFVVVVNGNLVVIADNPYANQTPPAIVETDWVFLAVVRDAGTWKLYLNGLLQADTDTATPGTGYGANTWIGNDNWGGLDGSAYTDADLSYAFVTSTVLHSSDLVAMYDAGVSPGGVAGSQVLLSDGAGGSHWGQVTTDAIEDGTIADADVAAAADIAPTKLSHPGGTTAFLRADGTWATPASSSGGASAADTAAWMPLTTVVSSVPELVWDANNSLIPTFTPT